jgi:hypothetical protein
MVQFPTHQYFENITETLSTFMKLSSFLSSSVQYYVSVFNACKTPANIGLSDRFTAAAVLLRDQLSCTHNRHTASVGGAFDLWLVGKQHEDTFFFFEK